MHLNAIHSNALAKHAFEILSSVLKCNALKCANQTDPKWHVQRLRKIHETTIKEYDSFLVFFRTTKEIVESIILVLII